MTSHPPLPVTLYPSPWRYLIALPGLLVFWTLGAAFMALGIHRNQTGWVIGGAGVALLGLFFALRVWNRLHLTEDHIVHQTLFGKQVVAWKDLEEVRKATPVSIGWNHVEGFRPMNFGRMWRRAEGMEMTIPGLYKDIRLADLVVWMNQLRVARQVFPTLSVDRELALAMGALIAELNGMRHDCLHGDVPGPLLQSATRECLKRDWVIKDAHSLRESVDALREHGMREEYEMLVQALTQHRTLSEPLALLDESHAQSLDQEERREFIRQVEMVSQHRGRHPSILAWDLCRLVAIARFGAAARFCSDDEAWTWILEASQELLRTFGSWRELIDNYTVGRRFTGIPEDTGYIQIRDQLLDPANTSSPWIRLTWPVREPAFPLADKPMSGMRSPGPTSCI